MYTLILDNATKSLMAVLATVPTTQPTYTVHYGEATATSFTEVSLDGVLSTTPATLVAAPTTGIRKAIKELTIYNNDAANIIVDISMQSGANNRMIRKVEIKPGQTYYMSRDDPTNPFGEVSLVWDCSNPTANYGVITGAINGVNMGYTVSLANYVSGSLMVHLNGQLMTPGGVDWTETSPSTGVFTFAIPPVTGDVLMTSYQRAYLASGNADTLDGSHSSSFMPVVVPSTQGNLLTSTGSVWQSSTPPSNRNAIINGAMDIWQRGTSFVNPASGAYYADRYRSIHTLGNGTFSILQSAETPTGSFPFNYSLQLDTTAAESVVDAGEKALLQYTMEGFDFKRFEGNITTLSFWVKAVKTGIYCVAFRNNANDKSYVHEYTITASNTWEKKTVTLTFNAMGGTAFEHTTGMGLSISWAVMCGSTLQTASIDTWATGNYVATANQVNGMDSTANNFYLTGVQMELGSIATPFEFRPYQQELALCQRYCNAIIAASIEQICAGWAYTTSAAQVRLPMPIMRTTPTLEATAGDWKLGDINTVSVDVTSLSLSGNSSSRYAVLTVGVALTPLTILASYLFFADASGPRTLILSAEL